MPRLEFFIVALSYVADRKTNRISVFDILETIRPKRFPAILTRFVALSVWEIPEHELGKDFQIGVEMRGTGADTGPDEKFTHNFTAEKPRHRAVLTFKGVPILGPGTLEFALSLNGEPFAHHKIVVQDPDPSTIEEGWVLYPNKLKWVSADSEEGSAQAVPHDD